MVDPIIDRLSTIHRIEVSINDPRNGWFPMEIPMKMDDYTVDGTIGHYETLQNHGILMG